MDYYYKNALADEVVFVHEGSGELISQMGSEHFGPGDYVVIPRTIIHQFTLNEGPVRLLIIETFSPIETVRRYRNHFGQLLEHSPYCERDMRPPTELVRTIAARQRVPGADQERRLPAPVLLRLQPARCGGLGRLLLPLRHFTSMILSR